MGSREIGSVMATDSMSEMPICPEPMFHYGWDANFSGGQNGNHQNEFGMLENQTPFSSGMLLPKIPGFETGDFSDDDGALGSLLNGKKKRKSLEVEKHKDHRNVGTCELPKGDETKNLTRGSRNDKQAQGKAGSPPCKEDYILVRAKRGQATNSHSLAERVRREKISERMKLLQDLVPGCNKITGKAVMLDEIINYVQSLQQQVEFLSMKLATVNPDINVDIERLLTKDLLLHPQGGIGNAIGPVLSSSHAFLPGFSHGPINGFPGAPPPFLPLPPKLWNNELQSILQMGFDSNPSLSVSGSNGLTKMEM